MMGLKVIKFGGTSLCNAEQMRKAVSIVKDDDARRYVVVSAPGKRFSEDSKITDLLYAAYDERDAKKRSALIQTVKMRFLEIINAFSLPRSLSEELQRFGESEDRLYGRDYLVSRGEYFCAKIVAACLGYDFVDAALGIVFSEEGVLDSALTQKKMSALLKMHERAVIPGFYGSAPNDTIKTFPRGGSDITGAVVAAAIDADLYENFTDVSGFLLADPKIVDKSDTVDIISYRELRRLSYMGASVLHEDSIFPVRMAGIPINIRNTDRPNDAGTMIVPRKDKVGTVCGIAGKRGFAVIHVLRDRIGEDAATLRGILSAFERRCLTVYAVPRGIDSVGIVVFARDLERKCDYILNEICQYAESCTVGLVTDVALISVVGERMPPSVSGCVFEALAELDERPLLMDGGSDDLGFTVGIHEDNMEAVIRKIYDRLTKKYHAKGK